MLVMKFGVRSEFLCSQRCSHKHGTALVPEDHCTHNIYEQVVEPLTDSREMGDVPLGVYLALLF